MDEKQQQIFDLVRATFKNDKNEPFELTPSQIKIFSAILKREYPRMHVMTYTQYGKSEVVALAVLARITTFPEKWCIVAPTVDKAKIIMSKITQHIFDRGVSGPIASMLKIKKDENLERIRRERSKNRLTFRLSDGIGEVFILSAEATRKGEDAGNRMMGFGAPNLVQDESALIPDDVHSKALRMLGGHEDNFLCKIGNPLKRDKPNSHFFKSSNNPRYHKIIVNDEVGLAEGRQKPAFFEEMLDEMGEAMYAMLYKCQFPPADAIDDEGFMPLLTDEDIKKAETENFHHVGEERLGCDVAGGGSNYSVIVLRSQSGAEVLYKQDNPDIMSFTGIIIKTAEEHKIDFRNVFIDSIGIGEGVCARLRELRKPINAINIGMKAAKATHNLDFANKKAEAYWRLTEWIKRGNKLKPSEDWYELPKVKYRIASDKRIQVISKKDLRARRIASPDVADALMLTFIYPDNPFAYKEKPPIEGIGTPHIGGKRFDKPIVGT